MAISDAFHLVTEVEGKGEVSTIDLNWMPGFTFPSDILGGPYETCIFFTEGSSEVVDRYSTKELAEEGHKEWVSKLEKGEIKPYV